MVLEDFPKACLEAGHTGRLHGTYERGAPKMTPYCEILTVTPLRAEAPTRALLPNPISCAILCSKNEETILIPTGKSSEGIDCIPLPPPLPPLFSSPNTSPHLIRPVIRTLRPVIRNY